MAWSQEQLRNAGIIVSVGRQMGMSTRDIQIGIITAMVESNLVNVNYGDRDSLGLFQQRPSQGWGTPEQVTNPTYAATKFFKALKGLGEKRFQMGMGQAAQAVQRSAFPERYAERIGSMRKMWPLIQSSAGEQPMTLEGKPYGDQLGLPAPDPMTPDAGTMLGAWGLNSPQAVDLDEFSGLGTFIGPHTNESVIQPMSQEFGGFEKGVNGWRKAVIEYARNAVGTPYVWGGTNLGSGVDCSGLIQAIFGKAGIDVPRISYQQANLGKRVGLKQLRPGDLYAWDNSSRNNGADHIALYIGNGMIIEAPRPGSSVRIRQISKSEGGWGVSLSF
jgi:cell wall-associated NlpC family hydrolase